MRYLIIALIACACTACEPPTTPNRTCTTTNLPGLPKCISYTSPSIRTVKCVGWSKALGKGIAVVRHDDGSLQLDVSAEWPYADMFSVVCRGL